MHWGWGRKGSLMVENIKLLNLPPPSFSEMAPGAGEIGTNVVPFIATACKEVNASCSIDAQFSIF